MLGVNYAIYGCCSSRTTSGVSVYRSNTEGKTLLQLLLKMSTWKGKSKTKLCILVDYSFKPEFFNTLAIG